MLDAAQLLGWLSAGLLITAVIAWLKLGRTPLHQRLGGRVALDSKPGQVAAKFLMAAAALSAVAAFLAVFS